MARLDALWRHPIKSIGRESVESAELTVGSTFPGDRIWAVRHDRAKVTAEAPHWAVKANFLTGVRLPVLAAVTSRLDEATGEITLNHPGAASLVFKPSSAEGQRALIDWLAALLPEGPRPDGVIHLSDRGMTDSDWPSISLINLASGDEVSRHLGIEIAATRWRCNLWTTGLEPWGERELIGKRLRIGAAELLVREHIGRCMHTAANPETGLRDADTLGALRTLTGTQDFGIFCEVIRSGQIRSGDSLEVLQ